MAAWSKVKQQLENFLAPDLIGRVVYQAASYKFDIDKPGKCCITVDKDEVLRMFDARYGITWYKSVNEIINDPQIQVFVSEKEIEALEKEFQGKVPHERLIMIAYQRKAAAAAKSILEEQKIMARTDFASAANVFLSTSIDESLTGTNIIFNILAIVDRRVGKNRLKKMKNIIGSRHPVVQYFYELRINSSK